MFIVPTTYEEWEHCVTVKRGIPLTVKYVAERIEALRDMDDYHNQKFIEWWGDAQHARTLAWFREAEERLAK